MDGKLGLFFLLIGLVLIIVGVILGYSAGGLMREQVSTNSTFYEYFTPYTIRIIESVISGAFGAVFFAFGIIILWKENSS
jgi:cytochrome c biogenesis protein ResB